MLRVLSVCVIIINALVSSELCSNKTEFKCDCRQLTDNRTHLPVFVADCSSRQIENVPTQLEEDINFLDLSENEIQILDPKRAKLSSKSLHVLILSYNKINQIDGEFFLNIPNLVELDLNNNLINTLDDPGVFQNLNKLSRLDLSFNALKALPDGIFSPLSSLRFLDLSYNYMGDFLMQFKTVLTTSLKLNTNLTHLNLNGLNITELHNAYFDDFKKMLTLSLADNAFENIPTVPYTLEKLDLSGNRLTYVSARYLNYHSLKVLKLNRMPTFISVHHYAFYNLYALEKLSITDCPNLKEFSDLAFDVASKNYNLHPKYLSLARNGLETLNETYKYFFKNMDHVDLRHNPWRCDCDILWLKEYEPILYKSHELKCSSPDDLRHKNMLELTHQDLKECYPEIYGKKSYRIVIVVLTCAIILLCGLIFYLVRYPASWLGPNRTVGPTSPYSLASSSDHI